MAFLLLSGGQQRYLRPLLADDSTWYEYQKGIIIRLDTDTQTSTAMMEYSSGSLNGSNQETQTLFKSGSIRNQIWYVCTLTEIILYSLPRFVPLHTISLPSFNDLHHVVPTPWETILVAVSGLDLVQELRLDGEVLREWDVLGGDTWKKFNKTIDYRMRNTKPHQSHPNHLFLLEDEIWVTRFYQKDAISLRDPSRRIDIAVGTPHDGLVHGDFIYFTTVNGYVLIANRKTLKIEQILNLNEIHNHACPLGWCRGILVEDDNLWIGFSRIRPTKLRENVEWVKRGLKAKLKPVLPQTLLQGSKWIHSSLRREMPTHVACYDLKSKLCLSRFNVENHGLSAIFSIFAGAEMDARPDNLYPMERPPDSTYRPST